MTAKKKNAIELKSPLSMHGALKSTAITKMKDGNFKVMQEIEVSASELERRLAQLENAGGYKDLISSLKSLLK